jgi:hypothetical protein
VEKVAYITNNIDFFVWAAISVAINRAVRWSSDQNVSEERNGQVSIVKWRAYLWLILHFLSAIVASA